MHPRQEPQQFHQQPERQQVFPVASNQGTNNTMTIEENVYFALNTHLRGVISFIAHLTKWCKLPNVFTEQKSEAIKNAIDENNITKLVEILAELYPGERNTLAPYTWKLCNTLERTEMIDNLLYQNLFNPNNRIDEYGWTPLHTAVYNRNTKLIRILLAHGSQVCTTDINGNTALHIAIQSSQMKTNRMCSDEKHKEIIVNIITQLIQADETQRETRFHSNTKLVNIRNHFGKSALHYAVLLHPDQLAIHLLRLLLHCGADPDVTDSKQRTPLFYALTEYKFFSSTRSGLKYLLFVKTLLNAHCDPLNYEQITGKVSSLKQNCRRVIRTKVPSNSIHSLATCIPQELVFYLNKKLI